MFNSGVTTWFIVIRVYSYTYNVYDFSLHSDISLWEQFVVRVDSERALGQNFLHRTKFIETN